MVSYNSSSNNVVNNGQDTTLTKVFVGGLAWETPKEAMREHFEKYGDILEAVIISDKITGRSKGYGFVTFKDPEAAKKACEDATPTINGRRANCNLAALGARRPRSSASTTIVTNPPTPPHQGVSSNVVGQRATTLNHHLQWYYPTTTATASPFHHQPHVPYYGYPPAAYIATTADVHYNQKMGFAGGSYMNGNYYYSQMYNPAGHHHHQAMYHHPLSHYHFPQSHTMGLPAHMFSPSPAVSGPIPIVPTIMSKPTSIAPPPNTVCLAVEQ